MLSLDYNALASNSETEVNSTILAGAEALHPDAEFSLQQVAHELFKVDR